MSFVLRREGVLHRQHMNLLDDLLQLRVLGTHVSVPCCRLVVRVDEHMAAGQGLAPLPQPSIRGPESPLRLLWGPFSGRKMVTVESPMAKLHSLGGLSART